MGGMNRDTARKGVMDGQIRDGGGWVIPSSFIHISIHMKMYWIVAQCLLAHVMQLHPWNMNCLKAALHLKMITAALHSPPSCSWIDCGISRSNWSKQQTGGSLISQRWVVSHQSAEAICLRGYDILYWHKTLDKNRGKIKINFVDLLLQDKKVTKIEVNCTVVTNIDTVTTNALQ